VTRPVGTSAGEVSYALIAALVVGSGCLRPTQLSVAPDVTFAAHQHHTGLIIDRLPGGSGGELTPPRFRWSSDPSFVLQSGDRTLAALWLVAPAAVEVRHTEDESSPVTASVQPGWDDNAIRLTLRENGEPVWRTDVFQRTEGVSAPLSRAARDVLDVRGTFRADVRDSKGEPVGWLRVQVGPYAPSSRIYDGVLPTTVSGPLAVAAAAALSSEIDWIMQHTLNVYREDDWTGPLQQSFPIQR
jgi:hypothetical protein